MNNDFLKLSGVIIAILVIAMLFLIGGCAPAPTAPPSTPEKRAPITPSPTPEKIELGELQELERNIVIEAEEVTLHYFEQKKWAADEFSKLIEGQNRFKADQVEKFKETYRVNAGNFDVEIDKEEKLSILKRDIYIELDTWYDFHWFLNSLGLDFINNHFQRLEGELSWEGPLEGVKTSILLKFPFKINNCHAHVWPAK